MLEWKFHAEHAAKILGHIEEECDDPQIASVCALIAIGKALCAIAERLDLVAEQM